MLVYIVLLCILLILGWLYDKAPQKSKYSWLYLVGVVLSVSFISGMRDIGVGTDTTIYTIDYFQAGSELTLKDFFVNPENYDRGYLLLNYIASLFGREYWLGMFFTHLFMWSILLIAVVKLKNTHKFSLTLFLFVYFAVFYNMSLNYMRQFCAMSVVLLAYHYYLTKEWKKAIALVVLAIMFHSSAIISLLIPFLNYIVHIQSKKIKATIIVITFLFLILITKFFNELLQFGFSYELFKNVYLDRYGAATTTFESGNFGNDTLALFVLELLIIIDSWKRNIIDKIKLQYLILLHVAYLSFYSLTKISVFLFRNSYYFYLIDLFYITYLLSKRKNNRVLYVLFCISLMIYWYRYFIMSKQCETYPYSSVMLGIR